MAKIGLPKGSGKRLKVREKSVKSQGILKWILSGNPEDALKTLFVLLFSNNNKMISRPWIHKMFNRIALFFSRLFLHLLKVNFTKCLTELLTFLNAS